MIHENLIRQALIELDLTADAFSLLCGMSQSRLSRAFKGRQDFSGEEVRNLSTLIQAMRDIARESDPIPVNFRDVRKISYLIGKKRLGLHAIPIFIGPAEIVEQTERELQVAQQ